MKHLLFLIFFTTAGYSYYRYPEAYRCLSIIAEETVIKPVREFVDDKLECSVDDLKNYYDEFVDSHLSDIKNMYARNKMRAARYYSRVCVKIAECKQWTYCLKEQMPSIGSMYADAELSESNDTIRDEPLIKGDIYNIKYEVTYKGRSIRAQSRSLGKPRICGNQISYTLPTGQKYCLSIPEGEGYIKLHYTKKI